MRRRAIAHWKAGLALCATGVIAVLAASCAPRFGRATRTAKANRRCTECHIDFLEEGLTVVHQTHGVTCMRCHGPSQGHIEDEVRRTKPDATFRGPAMETFCLTCHSPGKHRRQALHAANAALPPATRKTCTECHGEHELLPL